MRHFHHWSMWLLPNHCFQFRTKTINGHQFRCPTSMVAIQRTIFAISNRCANKWLCVSKLLLVSKLLCKCINNRYISNRCGNKSSNSIKWTCNANSNSNNNNANRRHIVSKWSVNVNANVNSVSVKEIANEIVLNVIASNAIALNVNVKNAIVMCGC